MITLGNLMMIYKKFKKIWFSNDEIQNITSEKIESHNIGYDIIN